MSAQNDNKAQAVLDGIKELKAANDAMFNAATSMGATGSQLQNTYRRTDAFVGQDEAEAAYEDWAFKRIVNTIPEDCLRQGIVIKPDIDGVTQYLRDIGFLGILEQAHTMARIHGAGLILVGANDGLDPKEPLAEDRIKSIDWLNVFSRWDWTPVEWNSDPFSPNYGLPTVYKLNTASIGGATAKNYQPVHASRLIRIDGDWLPPKRFRANKGWHASTLLALREPLRLFGISVEMGGVLLVDFVTKVLKSPGIVSLLGAAGGEALVEQRLRLAIGQLSSMGIAIIGDEEEYAKIQTPITGLVPLMDKYDRYLASASGIPMTRFFGQQLGKLAGATETTREYYDLIKSRQEKKLRRPTHRLLMLCLLAENSPLTGALPDGFSWEFAPLVQETEEQRTQNRKTQSETDTAYINTGVLAPEEVALSRFGEEGNLEVTTLSKEMRAALKKIENNTYREGDNDQD